MRFLRVVLPVTVLTVIMMLGGCLMINEKSIKNLNDRVIQMQNQKSERMAHMMLEYMHQKYDDTFEFYGLSGYGGSSDGLEMHVTSQKYPGEKIWVSYSNFEGTEDFFDSYVYVRYKEQAEELVKSIFREFLGCEVFFLYSTRERNFAVNDFNDSTTFEEYVSDIKAHLSFLAIVSPEYELDKEDFPERLKEAFAKKNVRTHARIMFAEEADDFAKLIEGEIHFMEHMNAHKGIVDFDFDMIEGKTVDEDQWNYLR